MSDDELKEARLERPDLVFMLARDTEPVVDETEQKPELLPDPGLTEGLREDQGITVCGMTLPANIDDMIEKVLENK